MSNRYILARALSAFAHEGQYDKAGREYRYHPLAVSEMVDTEDEKIVALLHDVLEDTEVAEEMIRSLFGDIVADAVVALTRKDGEDYMDFVRRAGENPIARKVKLADLEHNMNLTRLPKVTERDLQRVEKYRKAKELLQ